uniref:Uncharacterized protein n=1 Tax=viral metagenome TaxID=1070528 RepID=A0A6M3IQI4_9ZZZZ
MAQPDTWSEVAKIAIAAQSGTDVPFVSITETIDIDIGEKGFDVINTISGGRLVKFTPQEPTTITLEAYPVEAGTTGLASATAGTGFFDLMNALDNTQPIVVNADRTRVPYRVAIMWSDAAVDAEAQVIAPTNYALRVAAADGYFTSVKPSFTDGILKFTVTYKVPAFDKSGNANVKVESVGGASTATLTALASYTSSTKW